MNMTKIIQLSLLSCIISCKTISLQANFKNWGPHHDKKEDFKEKSEELKDQTKQKAHELKDDTKEKGQELKEKSGQVKEEGKEAVEQESHKAKDFLKEKYETAIEKTKAGKDKIKEEIKNLTEQLHQHPESEETLEKKSEYGNINIGFITPDKTINIQAKTEKEANTFTINVINNNQESITAHKHNNLAKIKAIEHYIKKHFHKDVAAKIAIAILGQCISALNIVHKNKVINVETNNKDNQEEYIIQITNQPKKYRHSFGDYFAF
ncbi:MAG: hypothetical protein ACXWL5_02515 [Candidatus Chromulinivorax sp.]